MDQKQYIDWAYRAENVSDPDAIKIRARFKVTGEPAQGPPAPGAGQTGRFSWKGAPPGTPAPEGYTGVVEPPQTINTFPNRMGGPPQSSTPYDPNSPQQMSAYDYASQAGDSVAPYLPLAGTLKNFASPTGVEGDRSPSTVPGERFVERMASPSQKGPGAGFASQLKTYFQSIMGGGEQPVQEESSNQYDPRSKEYEYVKKIADSNAPRIPELEKAMQYLGVVPLGATEPDPQEEFDKNQKLLQGFGPR